MPNSTLPLKLDDTAAIDPTLYAKLCLNRPLPADRVEIPGQISPAEERLLYSLLAEEWRGAGTVVEVGTLFGKSTQAIGLGILDNPHCHDGRLVSLDHFGKYFDSEEMSRQLAPLLARHAGWRDAQRAFQIDGFERAYRLIHADRPYARFHEIYRVLIPLGPEDSDAELVRVLAACGPTDFVFVDSAKSWYAVRALAAALCDQLMANALFVWQDYRWFNSYAIPVFHHLFRAHFKLLTVVDNTQVFRYLGGLTRQAVLSRMPAAARELGLATIEPMFRTAAVEAIHRNDAYGAVSSGLQLAFAAADCGADERATELLAALSCAPPLSGYSALFDLAHQELSARRTASSRHPSTVEAL